jgi:DNA-binding transcriptional ArsR family regulator
VFHCASECNREKNAEKIHGTADTAPGLCCALETQTVPPERLNITRSTVRWHLVRFSRDDLIEERKEKKEKFYRITPEAQE